MNKPALADGDRPFPGLPLCSRYAGIGPIEEARQRICRMIDRGEALGVVMGPPGTGKSLLCQKIASLYRQSHAVVILGEMRVSSRLGLIQQVLFQLGKPHQGSDEQTLHLALVQSLTKTAGGPRALLLIIDEAQMLTAELLDEVRMMTNLVRDGRPLVQTLLVGGPRLEETLVDPQLESLTQRIAVRCYLHPMTHGETEQYVRTAMATLTMPIDDQALASVHHASGGIPRLINHLMDQAIEVAKARRSSRLDDACVQIAWAQLQQLPSPVLDAELRPQSAQIEFGDLDGDAFDFDNESTPVVRPLATEEVQSGHRQSLDSPYADIASILDSTSIDCLSQAMPSTVAGPGASVRLHNDAPVAGHAAPVPPAAATIPIHAQGRSVHPVQDALFGADFDQEMPLEIAPSRIVPRQSDPAQEELSLHEEIRRLAAAAESMFWTTPEKASRDSVLRLSDSPAQPAAACDVPAELAGPLAVVWSDEETVPLEGDDRDILVIEDDVTMMIDSPQDGFVASATMRKPSQQVEQNMQNLFSRLRGGQ